MMGYHDAGKQAHDNRGLAAGMEQYVAKRIIAALLAAGGTLSAAAANMPPAVTITAPESNSEFVAPAAITLRATAEDSDGTIASVSFYDGATLIGTVTNAPHTYQWSGAAPGSYSISAKAVDDLGAETISESKAVTIQASSATAQVFYVYTDQVATAREIADGSGVKVWQADSEPFGTNLPNENPDGNGTFTYIRGFLGSIMIVRRDCITTITGIMIRRRGGISRAIRLGLRAA